MMGRARWADDGGAIMLGRKSRRADGFPLSMIKRAGFEPLPIGH
jgi:hypothetical protein